MNENTAQQPVQGLKKPWPAVGFNLLPFIGVIGAVSLSLDLFDAQAPVRWGGLLCLAMPFSGLGYAYLGRAGRFVLSLIVGSVLSGGGVMVAKH